MLHQSRELGVNDERTETLTHRITYAPPPLESYLRMETSHTMHFCDGALLASFDALAAVAWH